MSEISENGIINRITQPNFILAVQMGLIPGFSVLSKFGENPAISSSVPANIWDYPAAPIYTFSELNPITTISSDNAGDNALMIIQGLDFTTWLPVTQTATLVGQNKVTLDTPLIRHNRSLNGNGVALLGNVYVYEDGNITAGIPNDPAAVRGYVSNLENQTLQGVYTIPEGKTGFFLGLTSSISRVPSSTGAVFTGSVRLFEKIFTTQIRYNLSSTGTSKDNQVSTAYSRFPSRTDFIAKADVTTNDTGISVTFDLLLVDTDLITD